MALPSHRVHVGSRSERGPRLWLFMVILSVGATAPACDPASKKATPNKLCDAFVVMLAKRLESPDSWGVTLDAGQAKTQCLKSQRVYFKQDPADFQTMARCAMQADTPEGWRMCGYPRRPSS